MSPRIKRFKLEFETEDEEEFKEVIEVIDKHSKKNIIIGEET